ncbi:hypothetical protein Q8A67_020223 [Cirrhinus molitorella]|uniref:Uncharacterized protein n=1 Tax=Cirrhinus molitorella TaxID=172907 RepID=A0AA88TNH2_9TELE|nr:hypothetical protein Q8A67_020223 [Cirrhinus molitorella]
MGKSQREDERAAQHASPPLRRPPNEIIKNHAESLQTLPTSLLWIFTLQTVGQIPLPLNVRSLGLYTRCSPSTSPPL